MNMQEVFDTVLTKLREQGEPSVDNEGNCMYRGNNGNKCAIGHLIPDELYDIAFEYANVNTTQLRLLLKKIFGNNISEHEIYFLNRLQWAHDDWRILKRYNNFEERMKNIAIIYNLKYTVIDTVQTLHDLS